MVATETAPSVTAGPVDRYLDAQRRFAANGGAKAPGWLQQLRTAAIARFEALGFPTTRQEAWRFTSVAAIAETPFTLSDAPAARAPSLADLEPFLLGDAAPHRLVFVNGIFSPALSRVEGFPAGVRVESLGAALHRE